MKNQKGGSFSPGNLLKEGIREVVKGSPRVGQISEEILPRERGLKAGKTAKERMWPLLGLNGSGGASYHPLL